MSDRTTSTFQQNRQADQRQRNREELQQGVIVVLDKQRDKFADILPDTVEWSDFRSCFLTAVQRNYRLLEADRDSLWLALQDCALAGLRPDGKEAALVIYGDDSEDEEGNAVASTANKKKKVQLLPMVWGLCRLVHNTGLVSDVRARCVYAGEVFKHWEEDGKEHYEYRRVIDPEFDDDPMRIIGAFAVIQFKDGSYKMDFMSRRQIERRRAVSRAKKGPWGPWYDEQAMKTVLKHVMKGAPKSRELQHVGMILDKDESLPTIEGERPVELHADQTGVDPVRGAFQGDERKTGTQERRPAPSTTTRSADSKGAVGPSSDTQGRTTTVVDSGKQAPDQQTSERKDVPPSGETSQGQTVPPQPTVTTTTIVQGSSQYQQDDGTDQGGDNGGFEAWLVDETGVETTLEPYSDALHFAIALAALCAGKPADTVGRILDDNGAAILDCCAASEQAAAIISAIRKAPSIDDQAKPVSKPEVEKPSAPVVTILPVPTTPRGQPHWPNYATAFNAELDKFDSEAEATAWFEANRPTYFKKSPLSTENSIQRHYDQVLAKFLPDADRERANLIIEEIEKHTTRTNLRRMNERDDVLSDLERWGKDRPELFQEVRAAASKRIKELPAES